MAGEFDLIKRYAPRGADRSDVLLGSGDDAALLQVPAGRVLAATVDTLVQGRHFPEKTNPYDIGWKSVAVNLSDLAAMGAEAAWLTVALTLPRELEGREAWMQAFCEGVHDLAKAHDVAVVGGDLTSGPTSITVQALGHVGEREALRRDAACPGDLVAVTGALGDAALALYLLDNSAAPVPEALLGRLNRPAPRLDAGRALAGLAHAAIDISDGLAADLGHVLEASGVGAVLELDKLPLSSEFRAHCPEGLMESMVLTGGDDYELCVCLSEDRLDEARAAVPGLTVIGRLGTQTGLQVFNAEGKTVELGRAGFDHFKENG